MAKQTVMTLPKKGTTDAKAEAKKLLSEMQASATTINPAEAEPANPRLVRVQSLIAEGKTEAEAMTQVDKEEAEEKEAQLRIDAQIAIQKAFEQAKLTAKAQGVTITPDTMLSAYVDTQHFINLRGFGSNRDVAKRLKAKKNTHLKGAITSKQQTVVSVAQTIPEAGAAFYDEHEPFMKIDGHSRAAAWTLYQETKGEKGLAVPEKVSVQFLPNMDKEKILIEYNVFIHSLATGTTAEQNDIDNKMLGYAPVSGFVKASWRSAFTDISRKPYKEMLEKYAPILMEIDSWDLVVETGKASVKRQTSGIRSAMLSTFATEDKAIWEAFWKDFHAQEVDAKGKAKPVDSKIKEADLLRSFVLYYSGVGSVGIEEVSTQAKEYYYEYSDLAKARAKKAGK